MIPFRGDQCKCTGRDMSQTEFVRVLSALVDHFNNGQPVHRHMAIFPHEQPLAPPHLMQPPSLAYHMPTQNFAQPYPNIMMPMQQQQQPQLMLIPARPQQPPPQSWIVSSPSAMMAPMPTFIPAPPAAFHPLPPAQPSLGAGTGIPQPSFSGGTGVSHGPFNSALVNTQPVSIGNGTGIPQPPFRGGTAMLKRKSHYLEESDTDLFVSSE